MATPDTADAFTYLTKALKNKSAAEIRKLYQQEWKIEMGCYHTERKMDDLRRCGCNQCRDEYYRLERDYYRRGRYPEDDYNRRTYMPTMIIPQIGVDMAKETKVEKVEEPKNYAVKLLVDQLKAQQNGLNTKKAVIESDKAVIKQYQGNMKTKNAEKLAIENKIKELSVALKKLGHKE